MTRVLVFGKNGLLGSEFERVCPNGMILESLAREIDIFDPDAVRKKIDVFRPDVIVNGVSYNKVDLAENEGKGEAYRVNQDWPSFLGEETGKRKVTLIHFSTDYVYGGDSKSLRAETEAPQPLGHYARSKRAGEEGALVNPLAYILRVTTLYGAHRSNHATWVLNAIDSGKPAKIVSDLTCSPSYTRDLALWTFDLIHKKPSPGIYNLLHKGVTTRLGFAQLVCQTLNIPEPYPLQAVKTADLGLPAPRPLNVAMDPSKWEKNVGPLKTIEAGLISFLQDQGRLPPRP